MLARISKFRSSFQFRLFYVFTLLTALLSFLLSTIYVVSEIRKQRTYATSHLHQLAKQLADSVRLPLYAENRDHLIQITGPLLRSTEIQAVVITSSNGKVLLDMRSPAYSGTDEKIIEVAEVQSNPLIPSVESALTGVVDTEAAPLIGKVRLERGTSDLSREIRLLVLYSTCAAIIFWMVVTAVCYLVLRQVTLSFNKLMNGLKLMQEGDYTSRISTMSDDEPGRAAIAINELAEKLNHREEENRLLHMDLLRTNHSLEEEVAERILAEQSIRESEQNLKLLLDAMPVGVVWACRDGKLEYLNNFFTERFGYSREEIRTADDWFSHAYPDPEYRDQIYGLQRNALKAARNDSSYTPMYEARVTCSNGTVRQIITKLNMTSKRTVAILIDITDREILQEQIIKAQKLESIGILAGGIAHNFNNALTGVLGFISLAAKQLDETNKATTLLQHAEKATKKAAGMAKQLLTFSRGGTPFKKVVSIRNLVEESTSLALNGTKVRTLILIPDSTHSVMADEDQIRQAFSNITINAAQAMPDGGTLTIRAENIRLTGDAALSVQQTDHVRLTFTDEGHGIAADDLNKIFDTYYTTRPSNTGLGLASVHSIITKHGGQIQVDSTVGQGTTVTLILQSTGQVSGSGENANGALLLPNRKIGSILVMDDEETVLDVARETVGFLGYQVTVCANGEEAIVLYKESHESGSPFMAVILDLTITNGMGGVEAAKRILEIDPDARLIVSSGLSFDAVMTEYRDYGFCAAITKPYRADELGSKLSLL
jgi:PAS domain S-box-containing protein